MSDYLVKLGQLYADQVNWRSIGGTVEDLVDGGYDITIRPQDIITKGPWHDVRAYGAVGDGVTNDTEALQAAIDAATTGYLFFPPGVYKVTNTLTFSESSLCNVIGCSKASENTNGSVIKSAFTSAIPLLSFESFRWRSISDLCLMAHPDSIAAPSKFIKINNGTNITVSHSQIERVRIIGLSKSDVNVGIDVHEGESLQGDNLSFRDVDIQKVGSGIQFRQLQVVGIEGSKIHFVDVKYGLVFSDSVSSPTGTGGGLVHFSSVQQTALDTGSDDTVVYIRASGTHASYTFTNLTTEKDSILLDVSAASAAANCIIVNLIGPRSSRNDRTNEYFRLGPATITNVTGGWLRTTAGVNQVVMTGDQNNGDSILNITGAYLEDSTTTPTSPFTISADDNSFYKIENCMKYVITTDDNFVDSAFYSRSSSRVFMPNRYKLPVVPVQSMWVPLTTQNAVGASKKVTRYLPSNTIITKLRVCITATTATAGYFQVAIPEGAATYVGRIDGTVTHSFECGWGWSSGAIGAQSRDFDLSDADFTLDGGSITFRRTDDDLLNATGYVYIEYIYKEEYSGVKWDIGQAGA